MGIEYALSTGLCSSTWNLHFILRSGCYELNLPFTNYLLCAQHYVIHWVDLSVRIYVQNLYII